MILKKKCLVCSAEFSKKQSVSMREWTEQSRFCSRPCYRVWWKENVMVSATEKSKVNRPKGELHPAFGKPLSEATRAKMAAAKMGKRGNNTGNRHTEATKRQITLSRRGKALGERNPRWKGGITEENSRLRHSPQAAEWRNAVFTRDDHTCQVCNVRGGRLHAHHVYPWAVHRERRFDVTNGLTVCVPCHAYVHAKPSYA